MFRVYAFRPDRLSAWFTHFRQLHEPTEHLSAADREMIAVVVSSANGCLYCLVAHGAALREQLGDPSSASGSPTTGAGPTSIRAGPRSARGGGGGEEGGGGGGGGGGVRVWGGRGGGGGGGQGTRWGIGKT